MNDPHVVALLYRVEHGESFDYKEAKPLVCDKSPAFHLEVKDKQVRFELKEHYATEEEAREAIEEYIRVWEFHACLKNGPDSFRLKFRKAEIVERKPTPGVTNFHFRIGSAIGTVTPPVIKYPYPSPASGIRVDVDVQTMFDRYMNHQRGGEPLLGTAYFCLTMLEYIADKENRGGGKKRNAASRYFQIGVDVLSKIGHLSGKKGGPLEARKSVGVDMDLTQKERFFLEEAIKKMIRRAAEKAHSPDADLPKISLSDLPPI